MIQSTLLFSTKFNVVPTTAKFVLTDLSPYAGEGIALTNVKGVYKIEGPSGIIYNNTNFAAPDIAANVSLIFNTVSLPLDTDGNILKGTYTITYTVRIAGSVQPGDYTYVDTSYYCYVAPEGDIEVTNSIRLAKVTSKDLTSYPISGVMPTITRTHTLWYPSSLSLSPTTSGLDEIQLSYPNVYTGTYTGKISTIASYVFADGLIVDYLITAVDETIVDNKTLCDIYCGIKSLTNEMLTARSTGDFGKAGKIQETLSLVSILFTLYDDAITCGKEDDATNWLNQIITLANITVGCGCTGDEPTLVVPDGGGGSGGDVNVLGDSSFGTQVDAVTVGSTTTYTVRLTSTYKNLILSALQTQDLSVAAFRAAGIPEEARGVTVTPVTSGGGTISLTPGTSKKILILTGSPTLSSALTVQTVGSPIDGDSFVVDYRATIIPGNNTVTIFGLGLSPSEIASGNCLIYTWYASSNSTWYAKLISNDSGSATQAGLDYWAIGSDYALSSTVLFGTNPSFIYKNIQSSGSGSNAPSGTTASNTWWQYVGNKSALYDMSDNIVFDVTTGKPFIIPTLNTSASTFNFLVLEGQEIKKRALSTLALAGTGLTNNKILVGNGSNVATEQDLSTTYLRSVNITGVTGSNYLDIVVGTSGTVPIIPALATPSISVRGTTTLLGAYTIQLPSSGQIIGDYYWFDYSANVTTSGNALTIGGITLSPAEALAGNVAIYSYWDSANSVWRSRKITYGVGLPVGTVNQTVRYNSSAQLESTSGMLTYLNGDTRFSSRIVLGNSAMPTNRSFIIGDTNNDTGLGSSFILGGSNTNGPSSSNSILLGVGNTNTAINNAIAGSGNNNSGPNSLIAGQSNTNTDDSAIIVGVSNNTPYAKAVFGSNNSGSGSVVTPSFILGDNNYLNNKSGFIKGFYGVLYNFYSSIYSNSSTSRIGKTQRIEALFYSTTNNASTTILTDGGTNNIAFSNSECDIIIVKIAAYQTGGSAGALGDSAGMIIKAMVKSVAGSYSIVGTQIIDGAFSDAAASTWTAVIVAVSGGFAIQVNGQANKVINWTANIITANAG